LLKAETLRASGPLKGIPDGPAMLIISASDRQKLDEIMVEWNPIFGVFNGDSSMPGQMQSSLLKSS
jgi:hypothetical protein